MSQTTPPSLLTGVCITDYTGKMFSADGVFIAGNNYLWPIKAVTTDRLGNIWCIKGGNGNTAPVIGGQWTAQSPCWTAASTLATNGSLVSMAFDADATFINTSNGNTLTGAQWAVVQNTPASNGVVTANSTVRWSMTPASATPANTTQNLAVQAGCNFIHMAFNVAKGTMWGVYVQNGAHKVAQWDDTNKAWVDQPFTGDWTLSALGFDSTGTMWCVGKNGTTRHDSVGQWTGNTWVNKGFLGGWNVDRQSRACYPVAQGDFDPSSLSDVLVFNHDVIRVIHTIPDETSTNWQFLDFYAQNQSKHGSIAMSDVEEQYTYLFYLDKSSDWTLCSIIVYGIAADGGHINKTELAGSSSWSVDFSGAANGPATGTTSATTTGTGSTSATTTGTSATTTGATTTGATSATTVHVETVFDCSGRRLLLTVSNPGKLSGTEKVGVLVRAEKAGSNVKATSPDPQIVVKPQTSGGPT